MLILKRMRDDEIYIDLPTGDKITIMVTDVGKDYVRLGIEAPREYQIYRDDAVKREPREH